MSSSNRSAHRCAPDLRVDELRVDAHPVLIALHRAFEHIAHAKLLADLLGVDALALVGEGGVARDDEAVADAREIGGEVLGDAVGEIVLGRIAGEIGEGQHHDREMRGLRRFRAGGRRGCTSRSRRPEEQAPRRRRRAGRRANVAWTPVASPDRLAARSGLARRADLQRVDPHRLGDVLQLHRAEIADLEIEPPLDLPVGVLGETDRPRAWRCPPGARRY